MASKSTKVIKVPGAKPPKLGAKLPATPKLPQLQQNMSPYMAASNATMPKLPKGL